MSISSAIHLMDNRLLIKQTQLAHFIPISILNQYFEETQKITPIVYRNVEHPVFIEQKTKIPLLIVRILVLPLAPGVVFDR